MPRLLLLLLGLSVCASLPAPVRAVPRDTTRVVILTGVKSHPPTYHEYLKTARLLKVMLEGATNLSGFEVTVVPEWPGDPALLDRAHLILTISDGQDGHLGSPVPFMTDERMAVLERQARRGCGLMTFHFSTFAPDRYGHRLLDWVGGYFDWQDAHGERAWYSDLTTTFADVTFPTPGHPVLRGVKPYAILEEFYFDIRFPEERTGWTPLLRVPSLPAEHPDGDIVAWSIERPDGGRGFGTTTGHFYAAWKHADYRRFMLNAIVWTAGRDVPAGGVDAPFYMDSDVTARLFDAPQKGLLLVAGAPTHTPCIASSNALARRLAGDSVHVDITDRLSALSEVDLRDYGFVALHLCADAETPLAAADADGLTRFVADGGGLLLFQSTAGPALPAGTPGEAAFNSVVRRRVRSPSHPAPGTGYPIRTASFDDRRSLLSDAARTLTADLPLIDTRVPHLPAMEGTPDVLPLLVAPAPPGSDVPVAWIYQHGRGRVFQTVLLPADPVWDAAAGRLLLDRVTRWVLRGDALANRL